MALKDTLTRIRDQAVREHEAADEAPRRLDEWKKAVASLFDEVRQLLADLKDADLLSFETRIIKLSEERLGTYEIDELLIAANGAEVVLQPIGRDVVGAAGRVDMYRVGRTLDTDRIRLVLVDGQAWNFAFNRYSQFARLDPGRPLRPMLRPLTRQTLEEHLDGLMDL